MATNTKYNPDKHHRRSIRLQGYDYAQEGLYFVTFCCQNRMCLFGEVINGKMVLNDAGRMVEKCWLALPDRYHNVILHEYVVMPNHFHGILQITLTLRVPLVGATRSLVGATRSLVGARTAVKQQRKTLGQMIGAFKSITTNEYIHGIKKYDWVPFNRKLRQRNYYEHIIRNAEAYANIAKYIINNPAAWQNDKLHT